MSRCEGVKNAKYLFDKNGFIKVGSRGFKSYLYQMTNSVFKSKI